MLLALKKSLEQALELEEKLAQRHSVLDRLPLVVYQLAPDGELLYANQTGLERLSRTQRRNRGNGQYNLNDAVLNYRHTQIPKAFLGIPSQNREIVWIIGSKTYEDLANVWPVYGEAGVQSVNVVSVPIEELKTLIAHASQYKARYSLSSLVGESPRFMAMKEKAARAARHFNNLLIVGEPGTGKQRLAHGIHQASNRAAGPLITIRCGDTPIQLLPAELFGQKNAEGADIPGKIELARGGTLFVDEIDKIPLALGETLAAALKQEKDVRIGVVEARAKATQVKIDASQLTDPDKLKQFQDAQNQLSGALGRLLAVSENYPDLKSNQNFLALQSQLEGTENRIAVARRDYIEAVRVYNTELKTFPGLLWAATFFRSNKPMAEFTANDSAQAPPTVKF